MIRVTDANFLNRGELYLHHETVGGIGLRLDFAQQTLENLHRLWNRPVHIESVSDNRKLVLSYDGSSHHVDHEEEETRKEPPLLFRRQG
jgi:stage V sporulation protein R